MPGGFATADERWLAGLMAATPLASLWPRGGRLSTAGARALAAAYAAAVAAAGTAMAALRGERTAQVGFFWGRATGSCLQGCSSHGQHGHGGAARRARRARDF